MHPKASAIYDRIMRELLAEDGAARVDISGLDERELVELEVALARRGVARPEDEYGRHVPDHDGRRLYVALCLM